MAANITRDPQVSHADTKRILETLLHPDMKDDPFAFVMFVFPWGKKNTPLEHKTGPRAWQKKELLKIRDHIAANKLLVAEGKKPKVYKCAIASGRGIGKSAFVAWITLWFMSCVVGGSTVISANTDTQLTSKTFGEIGKWLTMAINGYCFDRTQKKITPKEWFAAQLRNILKIDEGKYYAEGILWNEDNPDAFAGEHSSIGCLLIFDEASGIPQPIWDVSDGFFTDLTLYRFWFVFSNPRKNTGPFFDCFHSHSRFWLTEQIDSRTVEGLDTATFDEIILKNGEDSDVAKVEVKGEFPSQGDKQFISRGVCQMAGSRQFEGLDIHANYAPLVFGVDPARFGDDETVIAFRQGRDARSMPPIIMKGCDNMAVANRVAQLIEERHPDGVFIDAGAGAGIIDRLKEMGYAVYEVGFGTVSTDPQWWDHRTELWARMREWLGGGMIPDELDENGKKLLRDLTTPEYDFQGKESRVKLEAKEKIKKRLGRSPDYADALALTFHLNIARYDNKLSRNNPHRRSARVASGMDYKIFGGS
jgi:hypothetical protein